MWLDEVDIERALAAMPDEGWTDWGVGAIADWILDHAERESDA